MTELIQKTKSQRKTFTLPNYIVKELVKYSKSNNKKQSQIVALALEEFLFKKRENEKVKKKLDAIESLIGILPDGSTKNKKIQEMLGI